MLRKARAACSLWRGVSPGPCRRSARGRRRRSSVSAATRRCRRVLGGGAARRADGDPRAERASWAAPTGCSARRAALIATGFPLIKRIPEGVSAQRRPHRQPGAPGRARGRACWPLPTVEAGGPLHLLVFGGSQGARVMSDIVPPAVEKLAPEHRARLASCSRRGRRICRGCGTTMAGSASPPTCSLSSRICRFGWRSRTRHQPLRRLDRGGARSHRPAGDPRAAARRARSGPGSECAEPRRLGAAAMIPQVEFTADRLAEELAARFLDPSALTRAASAAKSAGITDAADRLAEAVLRLCATPATAKA